MPHLVRCRKWWEASVKTMDSQPILSNYEVACRHSHLKIKGTQQKVYTLSLNSESGLPLQPRDQQLGEQLQLLLYVINVSKIRVIKINLTSKTDRDRHLPLTLTFMALNKKCKASNNYRMRVYFPIENHLRMSTGLNFSKIVNHPRCSKSGRDLNPKALLILYSNSCPLPQRPRNS